MSTPVFFINERAFRDSVAADLTFTESAEAFISLLEDIVAVSERPLRAHEGIYYVEVDAQQRALAAILFADDGVDRDLRRRLMIVLARCNLFDVTPDHNVAIHVAQNDQGRYIESYAMSFALEVGLDRQTYVAVASRGEDGLQAGVAVVSATSGKSVEQFLIRNSREIVLTYRRAICIPEPDEETFFALSSYAFPQLMLATHLNFRHLSDGSAGVLPAICDHLAFLNDEFVGLAIERNWDYPSIIAAARISLSDESPNTKANRRAMRQREVRIAEKIVCCTLHTKLTPTKGRIHFHPPIENLSSGRVIIGIFADHLDT